MENPKNPQTSKYFMVMPLSTRQDYLNILVSQSVILEKHFSK